MYSSMLLCANELTYCNLSLLRAELTVLHVVLTRSLGQNCYSTSPYAS